MSFDKLSRAIPLADAASFFIKLKYGSAGIPAAPEKEVLAAFEQMPAEEQKEICKEAGVAVPSKKTLQEKFASFKKKLAEEEPNMQEYMAAEKQGLEAEGANETGFLRERLQQMQAQMQMSQQSAQTQQQQQMQMEQQIQASQQQIQTAQQTALMAQQQATMAQQQQMQANDEAAKNMQLAAQMRMSYQQLRSSMMDIASQDPAQQIGEQLKGQMPGMQGLGPEAVSMGQPPSAGGPMAAEGPAGQAPGAQAAPGAAPPEGEQAANNAPASGESGSPVPETAQPATETGQKQAAMNPRIPYAIGGAALGAGMANLEARAGSKGPRETVEKLEGVQGGGFIHALTLAQAKARLAMAEASEQHPAAATLAGGLIGASTGYKAAPHIHGVFSK